MKLVFVFVFIALCSKSFAIERFFLEDKFFKKPTKEANETLVPEVPDRGWQSFDVFVSKKRFINVWSFRDPELSPSAPVVLYSHGNALNNKAVVDAGYPEIFTHSLGSHFVVYDYPKYGRSSKSKQNLKTYKEAAIFAFGKVREEFPNSPVILVGRSMGTAVTMQLLDHLIESEQTQAIQSLVLISGWGNIVFLVTESLPHYSRIRDKLLRASELVIPDYNFHSAQVARKVDFIPVLQVHENTEDGIVPLRHGRQLADAFPNDDAQFHILDGTDHGNIVKSEKLRDLLIDFGQKTFE